MEVLEQKPSRGCKKCNKGLSNTNWFMIALSIYLLITSVYGTIQLFKNFF